MCSSTIRSLVAKALGLKGIYKIHGVRLDVKNAANHLFNNIIRRFQRLHDRYTVCADFSNLARYVQVFFHGLIIQMFTQS